MMVKVLGAALLLSLSSAASQTTPKAGWVNTVVRTPEGGFRMGNPKARVKIVEYGSRTCPTCARFAAEGMGPLRSGWIANGKASYEYRDFLIHGAPDLALALLNQCVPAQRFFNVLDAIFENSAAFGKPVASLLGSEPRTIQAYQTLPPAQAATRFAEVMGAIPFMRSRGLPEADARRCLADMKLIKRIADGQKSAGQLGVKGTPSFFVNGERVRAHSWQQLQPYLVEAEKADIDSATMSNR